MSTTNGWDIVGGFNQDYLKLLAVYLYTNGTLPNKIEQTGIELALAQPSLTFSTKDPNGLVLLYSFTGTMTGTDVEGTITIETDISQIAAGYVDQSAYLQLNGTSAEYASCGTLSSLNSETGCAFEAWINTTVPTQSILVFGKGAPGISLATNRLSLTWGGGTATSKSKIVFTDGNWHHVAVTIQGNAVTFLVDGQVYDSFDSTSLPSSTAQTSSGTLQLGQAFGPNSAFSGSMTEVRIWNVFRPVWDIQQTMNVHLSGKVSGLVGNWTFAGGKVVNQVNNQAGSVSGGATIGTTSLDPAMYLYGLDAQYTFRVSSNITKGKTLGDNKAIDAAVLGSLVNYFQSAHIIGTPANDGTPLPTTMNFITQPNPGNANETQLLSLMTTGNKLPPTGSTDQNQAFANDTQLLIPSGSNVVVSLWDYMFFQYILIPALSKTYGMSPSDFNVTQAEPAVLSYSGTTTVNKNLTLTYMELIINSEGLGISVQANVFNDAITANFKGTLSVVVKKDGDCPASDLGELLFSLNNSGSGSFHEKIEFTMQNFNATDGSPECLTYSFKNVDVKLAWNLLNPNVMKWMSFFQDNFPILGPCLGACCQGLIMVLAEIIQGIAENWSRTNPIKSDAKLEINEIVFNEGVIVFGTATPGASTSDSSPA